MILRKAVFLVLDLSWHVFRQTGNIDTYLLMKELEDNGDTKEDNALSATEQEDSTT
ncbi:YqzL family protein [Halobacillus seohaensis]|uniref:YqzL family protein n=1 Tax=Halobacillus seohaensis TaxID=447421 RepID=UPI0036F3EABC